MQGPGTELVASTSESRTSTVDEDSGSACKRSYAGTDGGILPTEKCWRKEKTWVRVLRMPQRTMVRPRKPLQDVCGFSLESFLTSGLLTTRAYASSGLGPVQLSILLS